MLTHVCLFSGIGGFSLAASWLGLNTIAMVEIDEYCQEKLQKNFANVPKYRDIADYEPVVADIVTAGFPCQPFSLAGKQLGKDDPRYLWYQTLRVILASQPKLVVLENVKGLLTNDHGKTFRSILIDLTIAGYDIEWYLIPASAVGAIHRRDRLWIIAWQPTDTQGNRREPSRNIEPQERTDVALECQATSTRLSGELSQWRNSWATYGLSGRLAGVKPISWMELDLYHHNKAMNGDRTTANRKAIKAFGNAIVPQIAYSVMSYGLSKLGAM